MPVTLMRNGNAEDLLEYLRNGKFEFQLISSNYTTKVKSDIIDRTFVATMQSKRTFAAFAKLKADLINFPVPNISPESVRYFEHDFKKEISYKEVINIDLKSAYARIFYNDSLISRKTFRYFQTCKKQERLASVGMLASRKKIFQFENGEPISFEENVSELSGFFFYCVKRTQEIMSELKKICGQEYLFTWVDGIYFLRSQRTVNDCIKYLKSINFLFTVDVLSDFTVKIFHNKAVVGFCKDEKYKKFNLPHADNEFKRIIMESIISINKTNENEKSKIKNPR